MANGIVNSPATADSYGLSGLGITLSAGVWHIFLNYSYYCTSGNSGNIRVATSGGTPVAGMNQYNSATTVTSGHMSSIVNISSTTTYNVQLRGTAPAGFRLISGGVGGTLTDPDTVTYLYAVRIA